MKTGYIGILKPEQLNKHNISNYDCIYLILYNDLDMKNISNFEPLDCTGKDVFIRGVNHTIKNLNINKPNNMCVGLISRCNNLYVDDLHVNNASITSGEVSGTLVGQVDGNLTLKNVSVNSKIISDAISGGVCGIAKNVDVSKSNIFSKVSGRGVLGGVCGMADTFKMDDKSNINVSLYSKYNGLIQDLAVGSNVGYLNSKRNNMINQMIQEEYDKLPVELSQEELDKLNIMIHKKTI